jgi:hypothetical protein
LRKFAYLPSEQIEVSAITSLSSRRSGNPAGMAAYCYNSQFGKLLPDAFYIDILALHTLDIYLQKYENRARSTVPQGEKATLVKFTTLNPRFPTCLILILRLMLIQRYKRVFKLT